MFHIFNFIFTGSPQKLTFVIALMNIIDMLSFLPYLLFLLLFEDLYVYDENDSSFKSNLRSEIHPDSVRRLIHIIRILYVLRIFKLVRYSPGLQTFAETIKKSAAELGLLLLFFAMGVLFFSTLGYYAEMHESETAFTSIHASFWWAIGTMTSVGFGDIAPTTSLGKIIGN